MSDKRLQYRVPIVCPACGGAALVKRSERVSQLTRQYHLVQCQNPECGWSGSGVFEITHTISMPSKRYQVGKLPPEDN